ncbi:HAD family hydrolase [Pelosinus baikalensis]|uniref:HAD family hydrolase n=1 Tax=Pelosinus baikalensis TaxID=2892015 RepID=A0ABS8HTJ8_9FIRM|nr:HAD family hydrolase [Pelosinus baikalensis]MCC5466516.1 HAD family hydrolase [Pelosinus baikalensis]
MGVREMKQPNVICFDYYMTLVELHQPYEKIRTWLGCYLRNSHPEIDSDKFYGKFNRNRAVLSSGGIFKLGIDLLCQSLQKTCESFHINDFSYEFAELIFDLFSSPIAYFDAHDTVNKLKTQFSVGLLTNADNYIVKQSISRQKFEFDFVITSEDAKANKPDNKIFLHALEKLGKKYDEILMVGDSQFDDLYGAGKLNIKTLWINRNNEPLKAGVIPPAFTTDTLSGILKYQDLRMEL